MTSDLKSAIMKPMSPHVASWLGTFVAAGIQHGMNGRDEKNEKQARRKFRDGIRMAILGPAIGLALWRVFQTRENNGSVLPIITASFIGLNLLKSEDEVEAVNNIIWLRVASSILDGLSRRGINALTHTAIFITFYGVLNHTNIAPGMLVKMTRRFLTPPIFDAVKQQQKQTTNDENNNKTTTVTLKDASMVFMRTFKGLFAYNYFLHFAAAAVSYLIRSFGSRTVKGARKVRVSVAQIVKQAAKEATILNTAVSASCALLVGGTCIGGNLLGLFAMPLPLYFCAQRVQDTVYFLFAPWCVKYLFRLHSLGDTFNARVRLLLGVYALEGPLRSISSEHEGYSWMIGVAFCVV